MFDVIRVCQERAEALIILGLVTSACLATKEVNLDLGEGLYRFSPWRSSRSFRGKEGL
jgi:hypothetical protein